MDPKASAPPRIPLPGYKAPTNWEIWKLDRANQAPEVVQLDKLHPSQATIGSDIVEKYAKAGTTLNAQGQRPIVFQDRKTGVYSILDGHHRIEAAKRRGVTAIDVDVIRNRKALERVGTELAGSLSRRICRWRLI